MKKFYLLFTALFLSVCLCGQVKNVKHVIFIGADGLGSAAMKEYPDSFPHLGKMMREGASTLTMRSVLPSSSAVNWASILMGAGPELHGYTEWGTRTPDLPSRTLNEYNMFPGIFGLMRQQKPKAETTVIYSWEGIGYLFEKAAVSTVIECKDDDDAVLTNAVRNLNEKRPAFAFIYFSNPDGAGHSKGWESPEYVTACKKIDTQVGEIMKTIKDNGMDKNSIVIFISDHGGINKKHGGKTMQEMEVPYILWGTPVKAGHVMDESFMVFDNAATIAHIFGLKQPQVWIGRPAKSAFK